MVFQLLIYYSEPNSYKEVKLIKLFNKKSCLVLTAISFALVVCLIIMELIKSNLNKRSFTEKENDISNLTNIALNYVKFKQTCYVISPNLINSDNISDSQIQQMINNKLIELNKFTKENSNLYNKLSDSMQGALKSQKGKNIRTFSGSITNFKIISTKINNNDAQLKVTYTAQSTYGQWQTDKWVKVSPSNSIIAQLEFIKDSSGKWHITSDDYKFAPGSEP